MKNFTIIPNEILSPSQLSVQARFLFCVLLRYCGRKNECFPSQITLGEDLGFSDKYIRTLLKELLDEGLISKRRRGWNKPNTYKVVKYLDTIRVPVSNKKRKYTSEPFRKSKYPHSGSPALIHYKPAVPPNNTYVKTKDKRSRKGLEHLRKTMVELKLKKPTEVVIRPKPESHENK